MLGPGRGSISVQSWHNSRPSFVTKQDEQGRQVDGGCSKATFNSLITLMPNPRHAEKKFEGVAGMHNAENKRAYGGEAREENISVWTRLYDSTGRTRARFGVDNRQKVHHSEKSNYIALVVHGKTAGVSRSRTPKAHSTENDTKQAKAPTSKATQNKKKSHVVGDVGGPDAVVQEVQHLPVRPVHGVEGALDEVPVLRLEVGHVHLRVLQPRDEHKPRVHYHVGAAV